jgi:hypothetical protein
LEPRTRQVSRLLLELQPLMSFLCNALSRGLGRERVKRCAESVFIERQGEAKEEMIRRRLSQYGRIVPLLPPSSPSPSSLFNTNYWSRPIRNQKFSEFLDYQSQEVVHLELARATSQSFLLNIYIPVISV